MKKFRLEINEWTRKGILEIIGAFVERWLSD